ncbi:DUF3231 family protein [Paenibacillus turpanensis]|uniref:DUF3231 family protein n=1 Tax=Paenibacillus turpanensis TaxID=2689078 RepID=UPI001FB6A540|nr:DUF3231 family protein [Paenibacillus turpanensis]
MPTENAAALTSSEVGYVWSGYMIDDMSIQFLNVFHEQVKSPAIQKHIQAAKTLAMQQNEQRRKLLTNDGFPVPIGFSKEESDPSAPSLFTEHFFYFYLMNASRLGLHFYSEAISNSVREDVRTFCESCFRDATQLYMNLIREMMEGGLYIPHPSIPAPEQAEFIQKESFLHGWFGDTRPLHSMEMANLYKSVEIISIIIAMCTAFGQTAEGQDTRTMMHRGRELVREHYHRFGELLEESDLPVPALRDADVTASVTRCFSDRLMLCHTAGLFGALITHYGQALGTVMKHDLVKEYTMRIGEAGAFSHDLTQLLISHEWLEKTPGAVDRKALLSR